MVRESLLRNPNPKLLKDFSLLWFEFGAPDLKPSHSSPFFGLSAISMPFENVHKVMHIAQFQCIFQRKRVSAGATETLCFIGDLIGCGGQI
jgi:hypothetical protein